MAGELATTGTVVQPESMVKKIMTEENPTKKPRVKLMVQTHRCRARVGQAGLTVGTDIVEMVAQKEIEDTAPEHRPFSHRPK